MSFNRNDPADLAALKAEVELDPLAIGYDAPSGNARQVVDLLAENNYTVSKPRISTADVRSATTYQAYNRLAQDEQEWLVWMTGTNGYNEENMIVTPDLRERLCGETGGGGGNSSIWAGGDRDEMEALMLGLFDVQGSRAEVLFGYGTRISHSDWYAARDS